MMLEIPQVLSKDAVARMRAALDGAVWIDGNETSGPQAALAKNNLQLPQGGKVAAEMGEVIVEALLSNPLFVSAALPRTILPPLFNRYDVGQGFRGHVDNAVRRNPRTGDQIRTDLSATLFLSEPDEYEGGELIVDDAFGSHSVKLEAGSMVLYPSASIHRVTPVVHGSRVASFFWIQSLIREDARRSMLLDMDVAVQTVSMALGADHASVVTLTGVYHNLLRAWAET